MKGRDELLRQTETLLWEKTTLGRSHDHGIRLLFGSMCCCAEEPAGCAEGARFDAVVFFALIIRVHRMTPPTFWSESRATNRLSAAFDHTELVRSMFGTGSLPGWRCRKQYFVFRWHDLVHSSQPFCGFHLDLNSLYRVRDTYAQERMPRTQFELKDDLEYLSGLNVYHQYLSFLKL